MKVVNKEQLKELILNGITTEELKDYDYSSVTGMNNMFENCTLVYTIPCLDTSNVTDMSSMFENCSSLVSIPYMNTSNVTDMSYMFAGCYSLVSIPELNISNVIDIYGVLFDCSNLEHCFYDSRIDYDEINPLKLKENHPEFFI